MSNRQPEENENLLNFIASTVEMIRDRMDTLATKDELAKVEARLSKKIEVETTAIRGDLEQVHLRLDGIDRARLVANGPRRGRDEPYAERSVPARQG